MEHQCIGDESELYQQSMRSDWQSRVRRIDRFRLLRPSSRAEMQGRFCQLLWQNRSREKKAASTADNTDWATFRTEGRSIIVGATSLLPGQELALAPPELNNEPSVTNSRMATSDGRLESPCRYRTRHRIGRIPVGFLGLLVAIVLWGTAYKFSLYHQHPTPSMRGQVAKLWLENRSGLVAPPRTVKGTPNDHIRPHAFAARRQTAISLVSVPWCPENRPDIQRPTSRVPIPSRSPPSFQLCLG